MSNSITRTRFSIDPDNVYGNGVCGNAFRTQKPLVNDDIGNSVQGRPWQEFGRESGVVACVALPLIKAGNSVGVLMFFIGKSWAADEGLSRCWRESRRTFRSRSITFIVRKKRPKQTGKKIA